MDMANLSLIEQLARLREQVPGVYPRDAARHLHVDDTVADTVSTHHFAHDDQKPLGRHRRDEIELPLDA